jgi:hypothetical protein
MPIWGYMKKELATQNIDMRLELEVGGKPASERPHSPPFKCAPRRASEPTRLMEPQGFSARDVLAGANQPFSFAGGLISLVQFSSHPPFEKAANRRSARRL